MVDLENGQSVIVSSRGGFAPSIDGNNLVWTAGTNNDPVANSFDIWYTDLSQQPFDPLPLIEQQGMQRNAVIDGDLIVYENEFAGLEPGGSLSQTGVQSNSSVQPGTRGNSIVLGCLSCSLADARSRSRSQPAHPSPTPKPTKTPSPVGAGVNTAPPLYKGIHAVNGDGWLGLPPLTPMPSITAINQRRAIDALGADHDQPYFGSVIVLASDLSRHIVPTSGAWGDNVAEAMKYLVEQKGVRVVVRLDPTFKPDSLSMTDPNKITPNKVVQSVQTVLAQNSWIRDLQIDNEPNIEWSDCAGCFWKESHDCSVSNGRPV